ncbi:MAG: hypothetical protein HGA27_02060 [Peptococcaceae bacterium]|nr:hypothetical protein [Peptococcaceae bacterium]
MLRCPDCDSTNILVKENKLVDLKTVLFFFLAFGGLFAISWYAKIDLFDALVPALIIYISSLMLLFFMNRNIRTVKCQDCSRTWRNKI